MSENIEFISAKDLPEATGEEVSVICLENGEMKQKPGASLGGGKADMVIAISAGLRESPTLLQANKVTIESGSLEAVNTVMLGGGIPVVKVKYYVDSYGDGSAVSAMEYQCECEKYGENYAFHYRNYNGHSCILMSLSDVNYLGYRFQSWGANNDERVF